MGPTSLSTVTPSTVCKNPAAWPGPQFTAQSNIMIPMAPSDEQRIEFQNCARYSGWKSSFPSALNASMDTGNLCSCCQPVHVLYVTPQFVAPPGSCGVS